ncbi:MAG TPA: PepSY-associated TM helix domain-containing protein [Chitinophagaceae bacterium]|nr:PepSY-associated TM helix domain-containing protein [Chitinophagaceae bacterium]
MKRGFIFTVHSIAGLLSGLFILIMSLSGAALVFHDELSRLEYPPEVLRANSPVIAVDSCYNNLKKEFPGAQVSSCRLALNNQRSFLFTIYDSSYKNGNEALKVFMHPQNGSVQKTGGADVSFANRLVRLHSSLFLGKKGEWLLGFFSAVFLVSIITGLIQYRKNVWAVLTFRKKFFRSANLHQYIGVWALLFNLMIAVTGFWMQRYVFKKEFYQSSSYTPVLKTSPSLFFSLDSSLMDLQTTYPGFTPYVIYFAQSKKGSTAVYGSRNTNSFIHSKDFADAVFLDSTGHVSFTAFVNEIDASSRYDIINAQVHYGQYGGMPVKIIYFVLGLTGGVLSITGFLLWLRRKRSKPGIVA